MVFSLGIYGVIFGVFLIFTQTMITVILGVILIVSGIGLMTVECRLQRGLIRELTDAVEADISRLNKLIEENLFLRNESALAEAYIKRLEATIANDRLVHHREIPDLPPLERKKGSIN